MEQDYQTPDRTRRAFARTNEQTISQRVAILAELLPNVRSIAEICCGDCFRQWQIYSQAFPLQVFRGLDIDPQVVASNLARGMDCIHGDALKKPVLQSFQTFDVLFFGPPLSESCDGHSLIPFRRIIPGYRHFSELLFVELNYQGTAVCIGPKHTTMGDVRWLYTQVKKQREDVNLRLIHYSYSTATSNNEVTEPRLKYVELWFSTLLENAWEIRISEPAQEKEE
jgi:hypothetical protein